MRYVRLTRDPKPGDHLAVNRPRRIGHHHFLYLGEGTVIHFDNFEEGAAVRMDSLEEARRGEDVLLLVDHGEAQSSPGVVLRRALSELGPHDYHPVLCNCQHFASYCATGEPGSLDVKRWTRGIGLVGVLGLHWPLATSAATLHLLDGRFTWMHRKKREEKGDDETSAPQSSD